MKPGVSAIAQEYYIAVLEMHSFPDTMQQGVADQPQFLRVHQTFSTLQALCEPDPAPSGFHLTRLLAWCLHPRTAPSRSVAPVRCTACAEHIVLSMPVTQAQIFWFLSVIAYAWCLLAELGLFLRGGVTTGRLTHTPALACGPGLTRASALAQAQANTPRVVIDAALIAAWPPPVRTLLRQDADGMYYLDLFRLPMFLQRRTRIHQHIQGGCQAAQQDGWDRHHWLATHMERSAVNQQP